MQTGTNLTFFQLTKMTAKGVKLILIFRKFRTPIDVFQQMLNLVFEFVGAFRIKRFTVGVFFEQTFGAIQFFVKTGTGQRRGEVIDNHGGRTTFGLRSFARIIDDKGVQIRQSFQGNLRKIVRSQSDAPSRQPFQIAVFAKMNYGMCVKVLTNPLIKRQIFRRRRQSRIVINRLSLQTKSALRLDPDENVAKTLSGNRNEIRDFMRPLFGQSCLTFFRRKVRCQKCIDHGKQTLAGNALLRRFAVTQFRIIGDSCLQNPDQFVACFRNFRSQIFSGRIGLRSGER